MKPAARRALTRMAWRDIKRNRWRSLLVVAMIALPIMGLTVGAAVMATITPTAEDQATGEMGNADFALMSQGEPLALADVQARLPGAIGSVRYEWDTGTIVNGSYEFVLVEDIDPSDPVLGPIYQIESGRAPAVPGEIAVKPSVLESFGVELGETIELDDGHIPYTVVGTVIRPEDLSFPVAIVAPGSLTTTPDAYEVGVYLDLPTGMSDTAAPAVAESLNLGQQRRADVALETTSSLVFLGVPFGLAALVLAETGLIATAAFVVGTRRILRTIGIIGASGAEAKHLKALVRAGGLLLGLVGSLVGVGAGLGFGLWLASTSILDRLGNRIAGPLSVPWLLPVGAVVLGTTTSLLAASGPARAATRIAAMDALAGRTPPPRSPGSFARLGLIGIAIGVPITVWGTISHSDLGLFAGPGLTIVGFLITIPLLVTLIGRTASRLPLAARIAARDTSRHGRRTGAAVAAATVALILPIAVATATLSSDAREHRVPYLARDQLVVSLSVSPDGSDAPGAAAYLNRLENEVLLGAEAASAPYASFSGDWNLPPDLGDMPTYVRGPKQEYVEGDTTYDLTVSQNLYIGGPDLLYAVHGEAFTNDLEAGDAVVLVEGIVENGVAHLEDPTGGTAFDPAYLDIPAVAASPGLYNARGGDIPTVIISPDRASELGLIADSPYRTIVRAAAPITDEQLAAAKTLASQFAGLTVFGFADTQFDSGLFRAALLSLAAVIALAIIAVAVALVSAESRRDRAILTAVGSAPNTRRFVAGYRAMLLTGLAGWLAIPAGFLPVTLIQLASRQDYPFVVPWLAFAVVGIMLPLIAGAVGALFSRRPPTAQMLRPIA